MGGIDVYRTPGFFTGRYERANKYDTDQTVGNSSSRNPSDSRSSTQLKLEYLRSFGLHNVTGLLLFNRSKRLIDNQVPFVYQGLTSRVTYGCDDRYLIEFNAAYNGSENFAKGRRYGFFPAVLAACQQENRVGYPMGPQSSSSMHGFRTYPVCLPRLNRVAGAMNIRGYSPISKAVGRCRLSNQLSYLLTL